MNNRTMATVYVDRDSISLKTRSRNGCSPQQFIILKKELQRLEEKKYLIAKDILDQALKAYKAGHKGVAVKTIELYIVASEGAAYYVVNGEAQDDFKIEL